MMWKFVEVWHMRSSTCGRMTCWCYECVSIPASVLKNGYQNPKSVIEYQWVSKTVKKLVYTSEILLFSFKS